VEKFYERVPCGDPAEMRAIRDRIALLNEREEDLQTLLAEVRGAYGDFKDLTERDLWHLNGHVHENIV